MLYKDIAEICRIHYIKVAGKKSNLINKILKKTSPPTVKKSKTIKNKPQTKKLSVKKAKGTTTVAAIANPIVTEAPPVVSTATQTQVVPQSTIQAAVTTAANIVAQPQNRELDNEVIALRMAKENCNGGELHASLIWNDIVDLDLHVITPSGEHLYYGHKESKCGGWLDKDMNVSGESQEPIENIFWSSAGSGKYEIYVHYFRSHCNSDPRFRDPNRSVPFRVRLIKSSVTEWFEGTITPNKRVDCFSFTLQGNGAVGSYVVLPPNDIPATFQQLCAKNNITYSQGEGFYALKKKENISVPKDMILHNTKSDTFTIGHKDVCLQLKLPIDQPLELSPTDIPADHRLFVQSTSHNRNIPADTHVLMRVSVKEALKYRQSDKYNFK